MLETCLFVGRMIAGIVGVVSAFKKKWRLEYWCALICAGTIVVKIIMTLVAGNYDVLGLATDAALVFMWLVLALNTRNLIR